MAANFDLETQHPGVISVKSAVDMGDMRLTLVYRHQLSNPSNTAESGVPETLGSYILCEQQPDSDGKWRCYVGKSAEGGIPARLQNHISSPKPHIKNWTAAVLLHKEISGRLTQDSVSFLEHELWDLLRGKEGVDLSNDNTPSGDPLAMRSEIKNLRNACQVAVDFLSLIGIRSESPAKKSAVKPKPAKKTASQAKPAKRQRQDHATTLADLIAEGYLNVGDTLVPTVEKLMDAARLEIFNAEGEMRFAYLDSSNSDYQHENAIFVSPSSAANILTEYSVNGWSFWINQRTGKTLSRLRKDLEKSRWKNSI